MTHFLLHDPIGQQIVAGVAAGLILAIIGLVWAAIWSFPKRRDDRRKIQEIHNQIFTQEPNERR